MTREMYEQKIKEIHEKFPDCLKHGYDEYRCKFYQCLLDLKFEYIKDLERQLKLQKQDN